MNSYSTEQEINFCNIIDMITDETVKRYLNNLYESYLSCQLDNEHYRAIFEGSWPSSTTILENALESAKKFDK